MESHPRLEGRLEEDHAQGRHRGKEHCVFFNDSQIKDEAFVEDTNMLLNTGDVPNIFPADERAEIIEKMQGIARMEGKKIDATPLSMYNYFIDRVKANLHIVLGITQSSLPPPSRNTVVILQFNTCI